MTLEQGVEIITQLEVIAQIALGIGMVVAFGIGYANGRA
jgi:hypothetical protein